jgi:tryptophanyl-tRNA synthetase
MLVILLRKLKTKSRNTPFLVAELLKKSMKCLFGGNPDVDVSFQYLKFFLEHDEQLAEIEKSYRSGTLSTSSLKQKCIELMTTIVLDFQQKRSSVNEDLVMQFMDPNAPRNVELDFSCLTIN